MAIDRIGKGGGVAPPDLAPPTAAKLAETARAFEVNPARPEGATAIGVEPPSALDRLRAGEIDLHGYLDVKVDEAMSHLEGLSAPELAMLREMLRDQLTTDPALAELVQRATGRIPPPSDE